MRKNFTSKGKIIFWVGVLLISIIYLGIRFYRLDDLMGFGLDQGIHLLETKEMIESGKIRLVGPMVSSKSFEGRNFFIGANYYYVLGLIGLMGGWEPMRITILFIIGEWIFYLWLIRLIEKNFGWIKALMVLGFLALSPYLVIHSRFFWNPHLLIPLSIWLILVKEKYLKEKKWWQLFLMAVIWGFAFACHYSAVFWGGFFIYWLIRSGKIKDFWSYIWVFLGFWIGDLPWFIFELRHDFYNSKTLLYVFRNSTSGGEMTSHYFVFPLIIFGLWGFLVFIKRFKKRSNLIFGLSLLLVFLMEIKMIDGYAPLDKIEGWDYKEQNRVVELITSNGCPRNFELAATVQGDTRAYNLRYLLKVKKCEVMGMEDYPRAERLFLVAPIGRKPENEKVWEVSSLGKMVTKRRVTLNEKVNFYELEKGGN